MLNKVQIIGNLGADPEIRATNAGGKIGNLRVAVTDRWNDRQTGERKERTEWFRVVIYNERLVDVAEKYLRKGRKVYLEGALETRKYTDQSGQEKHTTEVVLRNFRGELVLLDSAPAGEERAPERAAPRAAAPSPSKPVYAGAGSDLEDLIPFGPCWQ